MSMTPEEARTKVCQCCYHEIVGDVTKCRECDNDTCADCLATGPTCRSCHEPSQESN